MASMLLAFVSSYTEPHRSNYLSTGLLFLVLYVLLALIIQSEQLRSEYATVSLAGLILLNTWYCFYSIAIHYTYYIVLHF